MTSRSESQNRKVFGHLKQGKYLTALEALNKYRIMRLAARIYELRNDGHIIGSRLKYTDDGIRYAEYYLVAPRRSR